VSPDGRAPSAPESSETLARYETISNPCQPGCGYVGVALPTSPGTSSRSPQRRLSSPTTTTSADHLDDFSGRRRRRPWGPEGSRGVLLCREKGCRVACACFFWKARCPAFEILVLLYHQMSWSTPYPSFEQQAYLTPFTCLTGLNVENCIAGQMPTGRQE